MIRPTRVALATLALLATAPVHAGQDGAAAQEPAPPRGFPSLPAPPLALEDARAAARRLLDLAQEEREALARLAPQRYDERLADLRALAGCEAAEEGALDAARSARRQRLRAVAAVLDGLAREGALALADSKLGWPKVQFALHELAARLHERGDLDGYRALVGAIEEELELHAQPGPLYAALYRLQLYVGDLAGAARSAELGGAGTGLVVEALRLRGRVDEARALGGPSDEVVAQWEEQALDRAACDARDPEALLARRASADAAGRLEAWDSTWLPTLAFLLGRSGAEDLAALGGRAGREGQLEAAERGPFRAGRACRLARADEPDAAWELARQVVEPSTALFPWAPTRMQRWGALALVEVVGACARAGDARRATKLAQNADRSARLARPPHDLLESLARGYEVEGPNATRLLADGGRLVDHETLGERCARELLVGLARAGREPDPDALEPFRLQEGERLRLALSLPDELAVTSARLATTSVAPYLEAKGVQGVAAYVDPIAAAYAEEATPAQAAALARVLRPQLVAALDACVPVRMPNGEETVLPGPMREVESWCGLLALLGDREALQGAWAGAAHGEVRVALLLGAAEALLAHGLVRYQGDGQTARRVEQTLQLR